MLFLLCCCCVAANIIAVPHNYENFDQATGPSSHLSKPIAVGLNYAPSKSHRPGSHHYAVVDRVHLTDTNSYEVEVHPFRFYCGCRYP